MKKIMVLVITMMVMTMMVGCGNVTEKEERYISHVYGMRKRNADDPYKVTAITAMVNDTHFTFDGDKFLRELTYVYNKAKLDGEDDLFKRSNSFTNNEEIVYNRFDEMRIPEWNEGLIVLKGEIVRRDNDGNEIDRWICDEIYIPDEYIVRTINNLMDKA